ACALPIYAQPQRKVDLLDSNVKKSSFARQAAGTLGLANVSVHCLRVEHWPGQARFPVIISRAFAELRQFVTWWAPLLADDGVLAAMKGVYPETERSEERRVGKEWRQRWARECA